eukprot:UN25324
MAVPSKLTVTINKVYRYHDGGFDDFNWGCVHRNVQTLLEHVSGKETSFVECVQGAGITWEPGAAIKKRSDLWIEPHDAATYMEKMVPSQSRLVYFNISPKETKVGPITKTLRTGAPRDYKTVWNVKTDTKIMHDTIIKQLEKNLPILIDDSFSSYLILGINTKNEKAILSNW